MERLVYPNPFRQELSFSLMNNLAEYDLKVFSVLGQQVYSNAEFYENSSTLQINTSQWQPGIYIINLLVETIPYRARTIKRP